MRNHLRHTTVADAPAACGYPDVRAALIAFQRSFARRERHGAVLTGEILCHGSVCPDGGRELFVTASDFANPSATRAQHFRLNSSPMGGVVCRDP